MRITRHKNFIPTLQNRGLKAADEAGRDSAPGRQEEKKPQISAQIGYILLILVWVLFSSCGQRYYRKSTQLLMGTFVEVTSDDPRAAKIVFAEIKRLDGLLSKFNPQSEVYKLNRLGNLKVSFNTLAVIKKSQKFNQQSGGAFDVTVAPLVDIWKQAISTKVMPTPQQVAVAKWLTGNKKMVIDERNSTVKFIRKGMQIDLGGIAKGYAVDCAVAKLREAGIKSCLVNAGGNMYALGKKDQRPWKIGIKHPRKKGKMAGYLLLENRAVATSGDYEQYFEIQGRRLSHIIDPKTGYPADNGIVSVTVVSDDATTCDALGTAVFVLGKEKGQKLINGYKDTQVIILTTEDLNV